MERFTLQQRLEIKKTNVKESLLTPHSKVTNSKSSQKLLILVTNANTNTELLCRIMPLIILILYCKIGVNLSPVYVYLGVNNEDLPHLSFAKKTDKIRISSLLLSLCYMSFGRCECLQWFHMN
uniref:Uncharacterized protein n=1 Tax=Glossina pallidipes TaxID=7398 RepID=A0A1A9Z675_GLOPL